jgi:SecD/SecF fusion protein
MLRKPIDFMGHRTWFFIFSGVLLAVAIAALVVQGLTFGIEFQGGTKMELIVEQGGVTTADVREALEAEGVDDATVQPLDGEGFLVRTSQSDVEEAAATFVGLVDRLGLPEQDENVTTVGPNWGENITDSAMLALLLAVGAILIWISVRFEYKMSFTAVGAFVHDVTITLGVYALVGREVTPNTIAALLTIMGYSLYDTIVVFHRMKENSQRLVKHTFMDMANESVNQVFARSNNTSLTSLIPVIALLSFGGETLKDFAFALVIGLAAGTYSSIGVAAPIYALWKEREPKYQALAKKLGKA